MNSRAHRFLFIASSIISSLLQSCYYMRDSSFTPVNGTKVLAIRDYPFVTDFKSQITPLVARIDSTGLIMVSRLAKLSYGIEKRDDTLGVPWSNPIATELPEEPFSLQYHGGKAIVLSNRRSTADSHAVVAREYDGRSGVLKREVVLLTLPGEYRIKGLSEFYEYAEDDTIYSPFTASYSPKGSMLLLDLTGFLISGYGRTKPVTRRLIVLDSNLDIRMQRELLIDSARYLDYLVDDRGILFEVRRSFTDTVRVTKFESGTADGTTMSHAILPRDTMDLHMTGGGDIYMKFRSPDHFHLLVNIGAEYITWGFESVDFDFEKGKKRSFVTLYPADVTDSLVEEEGLPQYSISTVSYLPDSGMVVGMSKHYMNEDGSGGSAGPILFSAFDRNGVPLWRTAIRRLVWLRGFGFGNPDLDLGGIVYSKTLTLLCRDDNYGGLIWCMLDLRSGKPIAAQGVAYVGEQVPIAISAQWWLNERTVVFQCSMNDIYYTQQLVKLQINPQTIPSR